MIQFIGCYTKLFETAHRIPAPGDASETHTVNIGESK